MKQNYSRASLNTREIIQAVSLDPRIGDHYNNASFAFATKSQVLSPDLPKPDGTMRKLMDVSRMKGLGWVASTSLRKGVFTSYQSYLEETK